MRIFLPTVIALLMFFAGNAQRAIVIDSAPANTPAEATIYLAGSINSWNPGDPDFTFSEVDGSLIYTLAESAPNSFPGKITRGDWATVEGNEAGGDISNRVFNFATTDTIHIAVQSWLDLGGAPSDLPPNVITLSTDFFMPQLGRNRRIRLFLPSDYDATTTDYPVLYMHDGQNLFSASESFAGEWEVDEALINFENEGYSGAIVVAIDNGGSYRIDEYTPWANADYGGGDGEAYMEFIVNTLKPYVDENFRTLSNRENTGIMGSSLGGLISHYGGMKYQNVFSKVGVFSPSFWFTSDIYDFTASQGHSAEMKFYFLAGGQESASLQQDVNNMIETMEENGFSESETNFKFVANGQHSEWFWAQEFPEAFEWLYLSNATAIAKRQPENNIAVYPNPVYDTLYFTISDSNDFANIEIFDAAGRLVQTHSRKREQIDLSALAKGSYVVKIKTETGAQTFNVMKL
ncbi:T9SS type A sorting domain-containing protein [Cryomorpha ignava]|uniref:T9SS type A sorting domain-containing protein n=1 Tax=Cryomorpha ignava TaxID=101383 RepID=A0A7K3WQK1_9FLAO|nr:alpha/beta hydrolase-fold protein [Cryomorpha ignava]NEN23940.1 T9SS type A sorting domain-containing protein [Cryomorpha ignava]